MAIEAPLSRYKRTNFYIYIGMCLAAAVIFGYDGYLSKYPWSQRRKFYEEHTRTLLFRSGGPQQRDLDNGLIPPELRREFEGAKAPLSGAAVLSTEQPGRKWMIVDQAERYSLSQDEAELVVYKVGPNGTMLFNMVSPPFFIAGAVLFAGYYCAIRNRKLVAADDALVIAGKQRIPYDAIEQIDKTYFEKKGFFTITYRHPQGGESRRTLSDREYENLGPILDHLIAKIS